MDSLYSSKGGIGLKGEGEQQLELDRRIIKERIGFLKKQLITLKTSREEQKKRRQKKTITTALVGYTNAGKSSIMNKMCKVDILAEDKLFATLDSTFRMLNPDTKPPMILVDTVGFISNLPASLVNGFKTTLESALDADLLLIVCDLSDPNVEKHIEVTNEVLKELNITDKSCFYIFNKKDKVHNLPEKLIQIRKYPNREIVSSQDKEDMKRLREKIITYFLDQQNEYELFVPYADGQVHSKILSKTNIIVTHNHEQGIFYKVKVPDFIFNPLNLNPYLMAPNDPRRDYIK